ncbi:MFS transporter [Pseudomonas sp. RIT-PI-S]|uniref:MFS transporter n=1 Tax=Pseudomonas sp. RIT-PI-S TaxID=3035295 RepID=UPI0021DA8284|nr:MFS transporter [Pseudomonas sp. RIT-PI-S]
MAIYLIRFTTWGSWSLLFSFFAVWLDGQAPFSAGAISVLGASIALTNRAGSLLFVRWVGRADFRLLLWATQGLIALSVAGLYLLHRQGEYAMAAWLPLVCLFGLGHSLASLAQLTYIAAGHAGTDQVKAFSLENVALNLSAGITPYASALVLKHLPEHYLAFPLLYCLATAALCVLLGPAEAEAGRPKRAQAAAHARPVTVALFLLVNALSFFAFSQFYNVFPLHARERLDPEAIGLWFALSSGLIVILQLPLTRLLGGMRRGWLVAGANAAMAAGVLALFHAGAAPTAALMAVLLLTLAEMIFGPLYQVMALSIFPGRPAFAMAVLTLTWALAEALATGVGLYLVAGGRAWLAFALGTAACLVVVVIAAAQGWRGGQSALGRLLAARH